jgi:hypothetical protein
VQNRQLVPQRQILQHEAGPRAEGREESAEDCPQKRQHDQHSRVVGARGHRRIVLEFAVGWPAALCLRSRKTDEDEFFATTTGGGSTAGADAGGAGRSTEDCVPLPENSRIYDHILNLVDPDMTAALTDYLQQPVVLPDDQEPLKLDFPSRVFYELYPDEYDFLVFLSAKDVSDTCEGMHSTVNTPAIPGTGVDGFRGQAYGSVGRLLSVIGMDFRDTESTPPFAHGGAPLGRVSR